MTQRTPEQEAVVQRMATTNDSFIIDAKAGSGKTKTLIDGMAVLRGDTLCLAFNKAIQIEIEGRANAALDLSHKLSTSVKTVHAHGLAAFKIAGRKTETLGAKVRFMTKDWLRTQPDDHPLQRNSRHISALVSHAKNAGFGIARFPAISDETEWELLIDHYNMEIEFEGGLDSTELIDAAQRLLKASNARLTHVDFDDMVYLPLLHNLPIKQYPNVLIDEAQDISPTRRELAFRSVAPGGRLIAVGDPHQAIYGFTGADARSLQSIGADIIDRELEDGMLMGRPLIMPLSVCFRCDGEIIKLAQSIVPGIMPRPDAPPGAVHHVDFISNPNNPSQQHDFLDMPAPGDAILCRLNKPNVAAALGLLRRGVRARIEGRDLGSRLLQHVQNATPLYAMQPLATSKLDLETYLEEQTALLLSKGREAAIGLLEDEVDAVQLLIERCIEAQQPGGAPADYEKLTALTVSLFGDDVSNKDTVTLSSVHKAKGREWRRVFILGWHDYMPFHRATMPWELEQEENLRYVAVTRAEQELFLVHGVQAALDAGQHRAKPKQPPVAAAELARIEHNSEINAWEKEQESLTEHLDITNIDFLKGTTSHD